MMDFGNFKKLIKLYLANFNIHHVIKLINNGDSKNRAVLIGSPVHNNLGDHMIAMQCLQYINSLGFDQVIEMPEFVYEIYKERIRIKLSDTIFINGGGWMGDMYEDEFVIEDILSKHKNNKIIILPQTIFFHNPSNARKLQSLLIENKNLIITVRERYSYDVLTVTLKIPPNKCMLLPDIALTYPAAAEPVKKKGIALIFREDKEVYASSITAGIADYLKQNNLPYQLESTVVNKKVVPIFKRENQLKHMIDRFSKYELIITDRLHAMIFSYLANTKCLAVDNSTHKVRGVYECWLKETPYINFISGMDDFIFFDSLMEFYNAKIQNGTINYNQYFLPLTERIKHE